LSFAFCSSDSGFGVAPDGPLAFVPFAALPGSKPGTYLVEEVTLGYVTSGRHLLELAADSAVS
jgi:hypothetical protein